MKRLFEVEALYYVMAESEIEAEEIRPVDISLCSRTAVETKSVNSEWFDAIPFNADDDRTCGQIIKGE